MVETELEAIGRIVAAAKELAAVEATLLAENQNKSTGGRAGWRTHRLQQHEGDSNDGNTNSNGH